MSDTHTSPTNLFPIEADEDLVLENAFWSFACRLYKQDDVASTCLELQDSFGINVNALLFMVWLGAQGYPPSEARYLAILDALSPWTAQVVGNLRLARRAWKRLGGEVPALRSGREALKQVELLSEQIVCACLFRSSRRWGMPCGAFSAEDRATEAGDLVLRLAGMGADRRGAIARQLAAAALAVVDKFEGSPK